MTKPVVTEEMVNRFLSWHLPASFNPDCGISFKRTYNERSPFGPSTHEPTGTNLLDAVQARAMLEHVLDAAPGAPADIRRSALEEAAAECDRLTYALDNAGERYYRPATADRCARTIRALASAAPGAPGHEAAAVQAVGAATEAVPIGELVSLRRRAARYDWLRAQTWDTSDMFVVAGGKSALRLGTYCPSRENLDQKIDAALPPSGAGEKTS